MKFLLAVIQFLIYSNIWIGLGAAALTWQYYLLYKIPENYALIGFSFFATILTYTFQRYIKIITNSRVSGARILWMKKYPLLVKLIMGISTAGCLFTLWFFEPISYLILGIMGAISLFYVVKIPGKFGRNLRDIPSLKIFLIGLVWAVTSSFLPYFNLEPASQELPWLLFLANFIFIVALTIPFDIRDLELDEHEKRTIPQLVGEKRAIWISVILLLVNYPLLWTIPDQNLIVTLFSLTLGIIFIRGSYRHRGDLYFSLIIDGLLILQPLLLAVDLHKTIV